MGDDKRTNYEKWQDTIKLSKKDARWHAYDAEIKAAIGEFDAHLAQYADYKPLNWKLIKAMVWTESGGPDATAWNQRLMQIGNPGDPALDAILAGKEGSHLILPPSFKIQLTKANANQPKMNLRAGIGYLLMRAASYKTVSIEDADKTQVEYIVKMGDCPDKIAGPQKTTVEMLVKLNPGIDKNLKIGQKLKIQKASMQTVIKSWSPVSVQFAAERYNVGDSRYAQKLNFCLSLIS